MIAFDVGAHRDALEVRQRAHHQRQPELAHRVGHPLELVEDLRRREAAGDGFLVRAEDVDGEAAVVAQGREALRLVIHADQDERRLQRDGGEGAAGEAGRTLVRIRGGHHRDARTEVTENLTKVVRAYHQILVADRARECKAVSSVAW